MTLVVYTGPILGLEVAHNWNAGSIIMNTRTGLPRIDIDKIVGLFGVPEADDIRAPRTEQPGEVIYPSFTRGKTITYTGRVIGDTLANLRLAQTGLLNAFADRSNEGQMTVGSAFYFFARPLALEMDEEQTFSPWASPSPFQRAFDLSLRLSVPTYYAV